MRNNVFARFARWILSWADPAPAPMTGPTVYALVQPGQRVAGCSTNRNRIRAEALTMGHRGQPCMVLKYRPVKCWFLHDLEDMPATETDP